MKPEQDVQEDASRRGMPRREWIKLAAATLLAGCSPLRQGAATLTAAPGEAPASSPSAATATAGAPAVPPTTTLSAAPTETPASTSTPTTLPSATPAHTPTGGAPSSTPDAAPSPTPVPTSTATPEPPSTPVPTATPMPAVRRSDLMKIYPEVPSVVVRVHHGGVWDGETLLPNALGQMLDEAITGLTGLTDARQAWAALFDPGERIAIKVNTLQYCTVPTHLPLVMAVTQRLQEIGVPAEQIVLYDRQTFELENADYPINWDGPGVRCYGTDERYSTGWTVLDSGVGLSDILLGCDALINMPILKVHGDGAGMTFSMKNHYGTFDRPEAYHHERMGRGMAELNALPPIRERARLLIGDALRVVKEGWSQSVRGDSIFMGFDPVALDETGLAEIRRVLVGEQMDPRPAEALARPWLSGAAALGLGTDDPAHIELREVTLV